MSDNLSYLFAAFAVTWVVLFAYAFFMARRQHEVEREIRSLRERLEPTPGRGESDSKG